jgi:hypothetical protein
MPRPECPTEENILRAILKAHWDKQKNQYSSTLFKGNDTSVSRLAILGMSELFDIFHRELDSPENRVERGGEINVGLLQELGRSYQNPILLTVEE